MKLLSPSATHRAVAIGRGCLVAALALLSAPLLASSHKEAPFIATQEQVDAPICTCSAATRADATPT